MGPDMPLADSTESKVPPNADDRLWATLAHLGQVALPVFGALAVWLVKKEDSEFVAEQSLEALNFQIAILLASLVTGATCFLAPLIIVVAIAGIVFSVIAAVRVNKGERYKYPYTIRLVK